MFCPSCGAKNPTGARTCSDCKRALPGAPAGRSSLPEPAATLPDRPAPLADLPPTVAVASMPPPPSAAAPTTLSGPAPAPGSPPRILKRPQPLAAPPPVDVVPPRRGAVGPDDPTLVRPRVQAPSPITMQHNDPFGSEPSRTRPLDDLPPTSVIETEELPPAPRTKTPAPRPVTLAAPPPTTALPPEERPSRTASHAPARSTASAVPAASASAARPPVEPTRPTVSSLAAPAPSASPAAIADPVAHDRVRLEIASTPRVLAAALIDTVLAGALVVGALVGVLQGRDVRVGWQPVVDMLHADPIAGAVALVGVPVLVVFAYHFASVLALSGTFGHRALGLRVRARATGAKPGFARALVRAVGAAFGVALFAAGPCFGLFLDRDRRGLGDLIARTLVVRADAQGRA